MQSRHLAPAVVALLLSTACRHGAAFPSGPARCAGPVRAEHQRFLLGQWRTAVRATPRDLWIGFSRALSPSEVLALTRGTDLVALEHVLPERQGTYATSTVRLHRPSSVEALLAEVPRLSPSSLDQRRPTAIVASAAADFAAGRLRVVAVHLQAPDEDVMVQVLRRQPCEVYALLQGRSGSGPMVSARANPGG